jgi:glutamyl-tRNA synthetase
LLARQSGGKFILRIEDTDRKRYVSGAEEELIESLHWLGLSWDEGPDIGGPYGPYRQSERLEIYQKYARILLENGKAYYCFCKQTKESPGNQRSSKHRDTCKSRDLSYLEVTRRIESGESYVIRFRMPDQGTIKAVDLLRGTIEVENRTLDDVILVKSDGFPVYHLAAMVDDHLMQISHVFRTSEWLPTFPLHAHIYEAFGWKQPIWIHPSIFLKPDGKGKMSKRDSASLVKDGKSIFLGDMQDLGYLPEAIVNWVVLMGWSYDDHTEFFSMEDLIEKFDLQKLNASPAAINFSKLDHFNGLHIRNLPVEELAERLETFFVQAGIQPDSDKLQKIAEILQVRLVTLDEAVEKAGFFFQDEVYPEPDVLIGKNMTALESLEIARQTYRLLLSLPEITQESAEKPIRNLADKLGVKAGQLFNFVRVAVTGLRVSPPLFESIEIIGREKSIQRLENAIKILENLGESS